MADLSTQYMGLTLKNPIIAGASELTANMDMIKKIEQAGAAAIVTKSLFEEQIQLERFKLDESRRADEAVDAEIARNIFPEPEHAGPAEHLMWVSKTKESVSIPVIASLNCIEKATWLEYALKLAETGVDALELNFYTYPVDFKTSARDIESDQINILKEIKRFVRCPVSVKLSPFYTNPLSVIKELDSAGAEGLVLFNRLFEPKIDPDSEKHTISLNLSDTEAYRVPLRYAGMLYGHTEGDVCVSGGIQSGQDTARVILAGAQCVQIVSAMYRKGVPVIGKMIEDLDKWMDAKKYKKLDEFRGKLSRKNIPDPWVYRRAQYVRMLMRSNPLGGK